MNDWKKVSALHDIPRLGARILKSEKGDIAIFRNEADEVFAMQDKCPHKGGPLSEGIVFGQTVACPLHGLNICLKDGRAVAPDEGCVLTYPIKIEAGQVFIRLAANP